MSGTQNVIPRKAACGEKQQIAAAGGSVLKELCRPPAVVSIQREVGKTLRLDSPAHSAGDLSSPYRSCTTCNPRLSLVWQ